MISRDERIEKQEKLIKAVRDGSEDAFAELKSELRIPVVAKMRTWIKNTRDVNDLFITTWLKVREEICRYDPALSTPLTFVLTIAEREARDLCLRGRKKESYLEDEKIDLRDTSLDKEPQAGLLKKETGKQLNTFYMHLLELTLTNGGYPHQILAFMYSKVIFPCVERKSKRASGYPEKVVSELFDIYLKELSLKLENEYRKYSFLAEEQVAYIFKPFHYKITRPLKDILHEKTDFYTWNTIKQKGYLNEAAGNTIMRHYCRNETDSGYLTGMVTNWCYKVRKRVGNCFFGRQDLREFFFSFADNL